jgi:hypothetical protein
MSVFLIRETFFWNGIKIPHPLNTPKNCGNSTQTHLKKAQKSFTNPLLFAGIMKEVCERLMSAF